MNAALTLYRTTIGKKVIMAVTGTVMALWLVVHMLGNLQIFLGQTVFNHYAELIQSQKELLWIMRLGMFTMIALHIWSIIALKAVSDRARSVGYAGGRTTNVSSPAARSMRWGGLMILLFLIWHLLDLTVGVKAINPAFVYGAAYSNVIGSLTRIPVACLYILANIALGMHLYHGVYSVFQTLGINQMGSRDTAHQAGLALALLVAGGNIAIAIGILANLAGVLA